MPAIVDQQSEAVVDNDESPSESTAASASEYLPSSTNDKKNENESLQTKSSSPSLPNNDFDQHSASDFIEALQYIETLREKDKMIIFIINDLWILGTKSILW